MKRINKERRSRTDRPIAPFNSDEAARAGSKTRLFWKTRIKNPPNTPKNHLNYRNESYVVYIVILLDD
jgi:hypothetical protein